MNLKVKPKEDLTQFELSKSALRNLNKFNLSPTVKLVLLSLVDKYPNIFPSQQFIASELGISKRSVERAVQDLRNVGLIIYETKNTNNYRFTQNFLDCVKLSGEYRQIDGSDTDKLSHKEITGNKQFKKEHHKEKINQEKTKNDDVLKKSFISPEIVKERDEMVKMLLEWGFTDAEMTLKRYGNEKVKNAVKLVERLKPDNKGAYLRKLLMLSDNEIKCRLENGGGASKEKTKYHHDTQITGISVPKYEPPKPVKCASPLDFNREEALNYVKGLPVILRNSMFAVKLFEKWGFTPDETGYELRGNL